ncbi:MULTISPECIES: hypothetical protein [Paenibacillus]|uniref:Uncharacterized protein n=1 Tax=Paenibacillus illinoisensis TaxID=59845 RepID=A0A2W0CKD7_9BACL|nr:MULTISPECIES: hypothetical protein [Paenibacillus]MBE7682444.1 hypothetical protein [Paenibacillus sp. P13VS]MBY0220592.1 hypothetical protein [Paenibacillus illinoisensis]MCG7385894.1 hypothetical protein [Paenibacillus sp. ACRRY]MCM3207824.1 hypothetical protein [Paenibacillus illinoisensis]PAD28432.1 hypothetical protein CHH60_26300 [Paenibacillus sp. 7523-1]
MKLKVLPIALTAVISAVVLFGGWFVYRQVAMQNPIEKMVTQYEGVNDVQLTINRNDVQLKLDLQPNVDLGRLVQYIQKEGQTLIGSRSLKLDVVDHSNEALENWWGDAMFTVAQAMENKQYTEITPTLSKMATNGIQVNTAMDDNNVYVSLRDGDASKFIILPRVPGQIGVWPNA